MFELNLNELQEPRRDSINLDYRILSLVLACATRADLFDEYLNGDGEPEWPHLRALGLPQNLLADSHYLFKLPETQKALMQLQRVTQTLVELNDYCDLSCPADVILGQVDKFNSMQSQPAPPAGVELE